ncbi:uncharacterized protein LOC120344876 isoform X2 [Styela clava]
MNLLLIACFCLMVAYTAGNAAKCYTCSNCSDEKLSSSQLMNCSVSQTTCVKETKSNGAVNRYCTSPRESGCKQKGSGEFATDICFCNEMDVTELIATLQPLQQPLRLLNTPL